MLLHPVKAQCPNLPERVSELGQHQIMGSVSIWHWGLVIVIFASPDHGNCARVQNGAVIHAIASAFVPIYGLVYFFAAEKR